MNSAEHDNDTCPFVQCRLPPTLEHFLQAPCMQKLGFLKEHEHFSGIACSPIYNCLDSKKNNSLEFRTLFLQEMIKEKVLIPWISISYRHNQKTLKKTLLALEKAMIVYEKALKNGIKKYLKGHTVKPVFRKFN